jgi:hypothetical protein
MAELERSHRSRRVCAILVATGAPWAAEAERIIRTQGYAVASLADLEYADLVAGPGELRLVVVCAKLFGPSVEARIARLRQEDAGIGVIVVGAGPRPEEPTGFVFVPAPFDGERLRRVLPPV